MANGRAHLQLVPEPSPEQSKDAPAPGRAIDVTSTPTEREREIGDAVASAATGICYGLCEHQNGGLTSETRTENGKRIAALAMLRLDTIGDPGLDFFGIARVEGARILRTYFDTDFYRAHGPGAGEATIDGIISSVFEIVERVVASELAFRAN